MQDPIGRTATTSDRMDPARAAALHATLGLDGPPPTDGTPLPPFFHQIYFWQALAPTDLGRDGHPKLGGFLPDFGLPRRMWAGGQLQFHAPLIAGETAERRVEITDVTQKSGRTGALCFLTLRHSIRQGGRDCVTEHQDLVYREDPDPKRPSPPSKQAPADSEPEPVHFDTTLLFRYSALTFNGHRIHYDLDYARETEGYAGLVVHGPLLAQLMMLKAQRIAPLRGFRYRGVRALTHTETAVFNRDRSRLWVRNGAGAVISEAEADWGPSTQA